METLHWLSHVFSRGEGGWALAIFVAVPLAALMAALVAGASEVAASRAACGGIVLAGALVWFWGRRLDARDGPWVVDARAGGRVQLPSHHTFLGARLRHWIWFTLVLAAALWE